MKKMLQSRTELAAGGSCELVHANAGAQVSIRSCNPTSFPPVTLNHLPGCGDKARGGRSSRRPTLAAAAGGHSVW